MFGAACLIAGIAAVALAQTQAEMNEEAGIEYKKADAELNKVYKELREALSDEQKAKLKEVQLLWLKYRDANAEFAASMYEGGSIAPMVYSGAMTTSTEHRVGELKNLFIEGYPEEEPAPAKP